MHGTAFTSRPRAACARARTPAGRPLHPETHGRAEGMPHLAEQGNAPERNPRRNVAGSPHHWRFSAARSGLLGAVPPRRGTPAPPPARPHPGFRPEIVFCAGGRILLGPRERKRFPCAAVTSREGAPADPPGREGRKRFPPRRPTKRSRFASPRLPRRRGSATVRAPAARGQRAEAPCGQRPRARGPGNHHPPQHRTTKERRMRHITLAALLIFTACATAETKPAAEAKPAPKAEAAPAPKAEAAPAAGAVTVEFASLEVTKSGGEVLKTEYSEK